MGFRIDSYAKCWEIIPGQGNFTKVRMSISKKNKETGEYDQDFSGYVMMIGPAHAKAQNLQPGDRIKLTEIDVSTVYKKELDKEFVNYKCFNFEMADPVPQKLEIANAPANTVEGDYEPDDDDEVPF